MKQRLISAFFGILILILVLFSSQSVFDVIVAIISAMAIYEVVNAIGLKEYKLMKYTALLMPAVLTLASCYSYESISPCVYLFVAVFLILMLFNHKKYTFAKTAMFITVSVMLSVSFLHVGMIRKLDNSNLDLLVLLIGCWITDSCAYFAGYFLGKHKLAPTISPKKTIEGSVGGVVGVIVILIAYAYVAANIMNVGVNIYSVILVGVICGIFSQLGDLCASVIKRENDVKDFGNIMPGHGGVMDRFDSFLFVAPIVYYILNIYPIFV